ncbi:MAG: ammonium transporter [Pirellulales bacterium]|nr:ammonium transporter [Pirellulales bacterium]
MVDNLWIMLAGALVFIMHLGFATLESGLTRPKNTVNILFKNVMIICIGLLTYALIGFHLMYPGEFNGYFASSAFDIFNNGITVAPEDAAQTANLTSAYADYTWYTDFFFQAMFAATCATIVSGAVAGRIQLRSFLIFATLFVTFCYPITGSWKWGGGWLDQRGFYDFAGSTLVHSVGGWAALVLAYLLGARLGKYNSDGTPNAIPGSNIPLVAIGVFLLWFGWFGFNGGSVLSADPALVSLVLVTTSIAAAAGGVAAGLTSWFFGKPDITMALNGILAGLVGITAGADQMSILDSFWIGLIAGVLVYMFVIIIDKKIDDPVGAVSVHLVCGIWGTLAVGIFGAMAGAEQLKHQLVGVVSIGAFTVIFTLVVGIILDKTIGLRVGASEEQAGLDRSEMGMEAYASDSVG